MYYDHGAHVKGELLVMMKNSQSVNLLIFISNTLIELFNDFGSDRDGIPKRPTMYLNLWSYKVVRHSIKVKEFQRSFCHSDTERLSRSDEVLKLKNFKKDATLKLFKSTNQERYEHVGPEVTSSQDGQGHKMAKKRLCLVDDLKRTYAAEILERAHMVHCNPCQTPVDTESKLGADGDLVSDLAIYRSLAEAIAKIDMVQNDEALEINLDILEERMEQAAIREARSKAKMENYAKDNGKLSLKWEGPYEVTEALDNGAYKLRDRNGKLLPRT
ncbi:hypothetical protein Tco_0923576 [Tanacetum coccineum]|uniref:Reverse transcriptase domain-containing protein n=1 Tax=Tanacetum coccineum TaxID=301880 RepID=A0ABQ5D2U4_9ASTR